MAEAIVSIVLEQLTSIIREGLHQEVQLVVGVNEEVEKLRINLEDIQAVLIDAERRQVKEQATVRVWLDRLKDASYDIEDVLDEWNYAMLKQRIEGVQNALFTKKKVCFTSSSPCFRFKQVGLRRDIALKIKTINEKLDVIAKAKDRYGFREIRSYENQERIQTTSFVDVSEIYGRDEYKSALVRKLCESSGRCLSIISLVGMGGIGKTTLARLVYDDNEVKTNFEERMWVCVSEPFDEQRIANAIIETLEGSAPNLSELESLFKRINRSIEGKKFLLVLDDVWTEDYGKWESLYHCLKNSIHGSKILVTTRKESVARMMESIDIINVNKLCDEDCWFLFRRFAFFNRSQDECEKLEEIGKRILSKCKGLPLAAKAIGSLLRFKQTKEDWQSILDSELWNLKDLKNDVFSPLLLSYNDLPPMIKPCFLYSVVFPKDYNIYKDDLIKLWMANGYLKEEENKVMEQVGQEYFDNLVSRSFFQKIEKARYYNMHDLVHDLAQFLSKECLHIEVNGLKEPLINSSNANEPVYHMMISLDGTDLFPDSIYSLKKMRSFLLNGEGSHSSLPSNILPKLLGELTCLKALDLTERIYYKNRIENIPKEVGKLIHLRYLNLSQQKIKTLPEILCELYNLQTLNICHCHELKELPQRMDRLINLRHLLNIKTNSLRYLPIGIQRLTSLRTLSQFIVSGDGGHDNKVFSLECLKNLNLFGYLFIERLGNISDVDEARRSELKNQKNLLSLSLHFKKDEGERTNEEDEELLEIVQPPVNLEELQILGYRGNTNWPDWWMSLTKLRKLTLYGCQNCKRLPPLGKLSSLESLAIGAMKSMKRVSNEFLGIESDYGTSSSFIAFPKLKNIYFEYLDEWEEWDYKITRNGEENITIMPSLVSLSVCDCPKLKALPNHFVQNTTLKIAIWRCDMLFCN